MVPPWRAQGAPRSRRWLRWVGLAGGFAAFGAVSLCGALTYLLGGPYDRAYVLMAASLPCFALALGACVQAWRHWSGDAEPEATVDPPRAAGH